MPFDECALPVAADDYKPRFAAWRRLFGMKLYLGIRGSSLILKHVGNSCCDVKARSLVPPACGSFLYYLNRYERGPLSRRLAKNPTLP